MDHGRPEEVELKLLVQPEDLAALWRHPRVAELTRGPASVRTLESVYFDTGDLDLARSGLVLRLRPGGDGMVQTVKTREGGSAGLFRRGEWEMPVNGDLPDLLQVPDPELRARLEGVVGSNPLSPILRTVVRRSSRSVGEADWEARFDLDVGEAKTPKGSLPICELELELVRGDPSALYDLAFELNESVALRPARLSKVEGGLAALLGETPEPRNARRLKLGRDVTLEEVLTAIFRSCIAQIVANEAPARAGVDPEGVHQLRVAVRRLRSALSLFGDTLPSENREFFRAELRWLSGEMGDARDLDVFRAESLEPMLLQAPGRDDLQRLAEAIGEMREAAYRRTRAALDSRRYTGLILALGAWNAGRRWRNQPLTHESARLFAPAREIGQELLDRLYRKARRRGSKLGDLTLEEAHRLRIQLKKLRYAGEFLSELYPHRHAGRFVKRLGRLQDTLGHLNDQNTAHRLLERVLEQDASGTPPDRQWAIGFVSGWTSRVAREKLHPLEREWKAFAKQDPFWRPD